MPKAGDAITRVASAGQYILVGRVGLILPGGRQLVTARQAIGWYATNGANAELRIGQRGDALSVDEATLARTPPQYTGHPAPETAALADLASQAQPTCDRYATVNQPPTGTHKVSLAYKGDNWVLHFDQAYVQSYSIPIAKISVPPDCAGTVWCEGTGSDAAAALMCMGLDKYDQKNAVWLPMERVVNYLGLDLARRERPADIP